VSYDSSLHHVETITRSPIANESGMYTLSIESPIKETEWKQLEVQFPIQTDFYYLPKKSIEIQNQTSGYVYLLIHNQLQKLPIEL
jgi:hypothetical protein